MLHTVPLPDGLTEGPFDLGITTKCEPTAESRDMAQSKTGLPGQSISEASLSRSFRNGL